MMFLESGTTNNSTSPSPFQFIIIYGGIKLQWSFEKRIYLFWFEIAWKGYLKSKEMNLLLKAFSIIFREDNNIYIQAWW